MVKIIIVLLTCGLIGCATIKQLQQDVDYFRQELTAYETLLGDLRRTGMVQGHDSLRATKIIADAKFMLDKVDQAVAAGDKAASKRYLAAMIDIMVLLDEYEEFKK